MQVQLQGKKTPPKFVEPLSLAAVKGYEATIQAGISIESKEKESQFEEGNLVRIIEIPRNWANFGSSKTMTKVQQGHL